MEQLLDTIIDKSRPKVFEQNNSPPVDFAIIIVGAAPIGLQVEAIGPLQMRVSWTPPSAPPTVGYRISVNPGRVTVFVSDSTSHTLEVAEPGVYDVIVTSLSSHLPGGTVGPVQVTVGSKTSWLAISESLK